MRHRGFTIVELMVVIAVISILIALLLPNMSRFRKAARDSICLGQQREVLNAVTAYTNDYTMKLPNSGRTWPHMGMLDFYEGCLRDYLGNNMAALRCPLDTDIGWIARWWRNWYGVPMNAGDHKFLLPYEPAETNRSYYWYVKLYWDVDSSGILINKVVQHQYTSIRHPSNLLTHVCFVNHANQPDFGGLQGGFIDCHAQWNPVEKLIPSGAPWYGAYNLDWTLWGIRGRDVQ